MFIASQRFHDKKLFNEYDTIIETLLLDSIIAVTCLKKIYIHTNKDHVYCYNCLCHRMQPYLIS